MYLSYNYNQTYVCYLKFKSIIYCSLCRYVKSSKPSIRYCITCCCKNYGYQVEEWQGEKKQNYLLRVSVKRAGTDVSTVTLSRYVYATKVGNTNEVIRVQNTGTQIHLIHSQLCGYPLSTVFLKLQLSHFDCNCPLSII